MEYLVKFLGGYHSLSYIGILLVTFIVGMVLRAKWKYSVPIPLFGLLLMYLYFNNEIRTFASNEFDNILTQKYFIFIVSGMLNLGIAIIFFIVVDRSVIGRLYKRFNHGEGMGMVGK
jgi:hypothetical protein